MVAFLTNLPILAHLLIGFYFAFFGFWNIYHWIPIMKTMNEKNIPMPYFILPLGIGWQIIAGAMIMCNVLIKFAALTLMPFTVIAVCMFHPFWKFRGEHFALNFSIFVANVTIGLGALVSLMIPVSSWTDLLS